MGGDPDRLNDPPLCGALGTVIPPGEVPSTISRASFRPFWKFALSLRDTSICSGLELVKAVMWSAQGSGCAGALNEEPPMGVFGEGGAGEEVPDPLFFITCHFDVRRDGWK